MAFELIPVGPDDVFEPVTAAPAAAPVPEVGPKNIYKSKASNETITIPDPDKLAIPSVNIEGAGPDPAAKPAPQLIPVGADDKFVPPSEVYDPDSDWDVTRGFKTAFTGGGKSILATADIARMLTLNTADAKAALLEYGNEVADPRNASLKVKDFTEVDSLSKGLTYGLESIGQVAGSIGAALTYGGGTGAVVGGAAGSLLPGAGTAAGAVTGAGVGTLAAFGAMGPGGLLPEMMADPQVRESIANDTLDPHAALGIATAGGLAVGAIDAVPAGKWLMKIGGKQVSKEAVKQLLKVAAVKGAAKGAALEGGTEGLQTTIEKATTALAGGDLDAAQTAIDVVNSMLVGAIGGAGPGAAADVVEQQKLRAPVGELYRQAAAEKAAAGGEANEALPAGTTAPDPAEAAASGTASPGNVGANQPAQPAGAAPAKAQPVVTAPVNGIDPTIAAGVAGSVGGDAGAGPVATRTDQPTIDTAIPEEEDDDTAVVDVNAEQQAELARRTREQVAAQAAEDAARAQEKAADIPTVGTGDIAEDIAEAVRAKQEKKPPRIRTPKVKAPAAELPPVIPGAANIGENLGTGVNLAETPPAAAPTPPVPPVPAPAAGESPAVQPLQGNEPTVLGTAAPAPAPDLAGQVAALEPAESPPAIEPAALVAEHNGDVTAASRSLAGRVIDALDGGAEVTMLLGGKRPIVITDANESVMVDRDGNTYSAKNFLRPTSRDKITFSAPKPAVTEAAPEPIAQEPAPVIPRAEVIKAVSAARSEPVAEKKLTRGEMIKQRATEAAAKARTAPAAAPAATAPTGRQKLELNDPTGLHDIVKEQNKAKQWLNDLSDEDHAAVVKAYPHVLADIMGTYDPLHLLGKFRNAISHARTGEGISHEEMESRDLSPPKAAAAKETSAERSKPKLTIARKEPVALTGSRRVVVAPKATGGVVAERVGEVEVAERQPEAPSAPAAAPVAGKAKRNEVTDVVGDETVTHVSQDLDERINELGKGLVRDTIHDVTAAFEATMPKGRSIRERTAALRERMPEIIAEVKRRLEPDLAEHERQFRTAEEKRQEADKEKQSAESAKREAQAKADTGQKRERAKKGGMSAEGIPDQSDDSVMSEEKLQLKKKPKLRDQLIMQQAQLIREKRKKETTPERKAAIAELEKAVKAQRVEAAKAKAESGRGLSEAHQEIEADIQEATADITIPEILPTDSTDSQIAAAKEHIAAFLKATNHIEVAGRHDRKANSPLENLVVYARKLRGKKAEVTGHGAGEFWKAHNFVNEGELEAFTNLVTTEKIEGSELREETTRDDSDIDVADRLEEGESVDRTYRQDLPESAPDIAPSVRRGRETTAAVRGQENRAADRRVRRGEPHEIQALGSDGKWHFIQASTHKAGDLLSQIARSGRGGAGFMGMLRQVLARHLRQLVGDMQVQYISREDMDNLRSDQPAGRLQGFYINYSDIDRSAGFRPEVFMVEDLQLDADLHEHILLHELTHAATSYVITRDLRGVNDALTSMRQALEGQLRSRFSEQQMRDMDLKYAFTDNQEFLAEAMTNKQLQRFMANINVPPFSNIRASVGMLERGRLPTWWDLFVRAISDAVGMIKGRRGHSYMENIIRVYESAAISDLAQTAKANERVRDFGKPSSSVEDDGPVDRRSRAVPDGPIDVNYFIGDHKRVVEGVKDWATNGSWSVKRQQLANKLVTVGQLQRWAADIFGGTDNPFHKLADVLLRKDPRRTHYRKMGERIEVELGKLASNDKATTAKLSKNLHEASRHGVNHMVPLTHADNKHIPKTGEAGEARRKAHERLSKEFASFPAAVQKVARDAADHYRMAWDMETKATVTYVVKAALRTHRALGNLPAGKTEQDVVNWVLDKGPLRKEDERTPLDKEFRDALGSAADRLAEVTEARALKGVYFPLARRGKWFVTALEKLATPAGAIADPTSQDGNRFLFTDAAKAKAYTGSTDYLTRTTSRYVDPQTGEKVKTKEGVFINDAGQVIIPVRQFVVTVQNKHMIMHDNKNTLLRDRDALAKAGHKVSSVALTRNMLNEHASQDILPAQIATLLKHTEQTSVGSSTLGRQAVQDAIRESAIRAMTTPSKLTSHLKRTGQMGYDMDLTSAMREHNRSWASHITNMELAHDKADALAALDKYIKDRIHTTGNDDIEKLQLMKQELMQRFDDLGKPAETSGLSRFADQVMNVSFMRHLFSPHYTIINLMQPMMTTYPVLSSKYGNAAVWSETIRFYKMGGVSKALKTGFNETWNASRSLVGYGNDAITEAQLKGRGSQDQIWFDLTEKEADAAELHAMYQYGIDRGFGAAAGIEAAAVSEEEMNAVEKGLTRVATVAKGLPEAAESINRYHAATVTYRLARRGGMSVENAQREAWSVVEQTQGGYAKANSPRMFNNPLLRAPLQFKKYGVMYGQLFYGNLTKLVAPSSDPETRKLAAKTLAKLSLTTMAFAGVGGLPMVEVARMLANTAVMMGLSDDDWDDHENAIQEWFASLIGGAPAEALMHGATRLGGVDTSSALGADSLFTFGQPKSLEDEESVLAWMAKMGIGASGQMAFDTIEAIKQGDIYGAFPWPKFMNSMVEAYGLYNEGSVSKKTGEQYAKPVGIGEAAIKALGFNPASSARQWETGGTGHAQKEENQAFSRRSTLMGRWAAAKQRGDTEEARRIFQKDVKSWNREHKDKKLHIDMGALMRSRKERERRRKELEKSLK